MLIVRRLRIVRNYLKAPLILMLCLLFVASAHAQWPKIISENKAYFSSNIAQQTARKIIALQRPTGGWRKGIDPTKNYSEKSWNDLLQRDFSEYQMYDVESLDTYSHFASGFDNDATHSHLRYLLKRWEVAPETSISLALLKGIDYILDAQLPTGAWPQNFPNRGGYGRLGTLNDGAMIGVLWFVDELLKSKFPIEVTRLRKIQQAHREALEFLVHSQMSHDGRLTGWAQQYNGFTPAQARTNELPAVATLETVGVLKYLMSLREPKESIIQSVQGGIAWLKDVGIEGIEVVKVYDSAFEESTTLEFRESPYEEHRVKSFAGVGYDKVVVKNDHARTIWARFYDLETNQPIFVGWDGVKRDSLAEIDYPKRVSYSWYWYWPANLVTKEYESWLRRVKFDIPAPPGKALLNLLP